LSGDNVAGGGGGGKGTTESPRVEVSVRVRVLGTRGGAAVNARRPWTKPKGSEG